jgi:hypothetical protein
MTLFVLIPQFRKRNFEFQKQNRLTAFAATAQAAGGADEAIGSGPKRDAGPLAKGPHRYVGENDFPIEG